jgi:tRNA-2-methylthio-N6-dimethylallyladenosine synthase
MEQIGTGKTYFTINYGCQMNESDTEHYAGQLEALGYSKAPDYATADVVVVNTCCVRESAEKHIWGKIGELKATKAGHPGQIICVAGCMAQKDGEQLLRKFSQIDILLGTAYVNSFQQVLTAFVRDQQAWAGTGSVAGREAVATAPGQGAATGAREPKQVQAEPAYTTVGKRQARAYTDLAVTPAEFEGQRVRQSGFAAWIPIMYGCNNFCTYCIVPYVRGRERSRSQEQILAEVRAAVADGYTEITLLGQNVNSYGKDRQEPEAFARLLAAVDQVPGLKRVHYMTSHPRDMSEAVIKTVAAGTHLCENFHLPFQAGSDRILKAMNRGYTKEQYLQLVARVRKYVPAAALTTDIIVGFPGETDADFAETLDVVRRVGFTSAFTFIYSPRSGTPAAKMPDQVPEAVKHARLEQLMALQNEISLALNRKLEGQTLEVLADGPTEKDTAIWQGRTRTNQLVLWPAQPGQFAAGDYVQVRIDCGQTWLLKGTAITGQD